MTEWSTLRARFPEDELIEIRRIKEQYGISYNEILRSGVKFYVSLTLAKELVAGSLAGRDIKIRGRNLGEILNSPEYQSQIEQKIVRAVKLLIWEFLETGADFEEKTRTLRKRRTVGRPKAKDS